MEIKNIVFTLVFITAFSFLAYNLKRLFSYLSIGQPDNRFNSPGKRIANVLKIAFGQSKLLRDPVAGTIHFLIFWGFVLFVFAVLESIIQGFYSPFSFEFLGPIFSLITLVQDILIVLVAVSIIYALLRRFVIKVDRLQGSSKEKLDAAIVLFLILCVVVTMLGQNMALIAMHNFHVAGSELRPVSMFLSPLFFAGPGGGTELAYEIFWWSHIIVIFGFMNFLPYSKHLHVFTSIPNVYFSSLDNKNASLKPIDLEDEEAEQYGAADIEHLSWKQLLDGLSCTECGRCTAVCPAAITGKPLSPRKIIENIRERTQEKAPLILAGNEENTAVLENTLVNNYITADELWSCTTCMACVQECPVTIEHVGSIVDMRRNLVLMESQFPPELNNIFKNLENNFSPWAFNSQDRANWAEGLDIKTMADDSECEYLFWVGCAGSFDARYQKVSIAIAKLLQKANISFRILGTEEKCNGDTARRLGNEYLAQMLIQENVETLNNYKVKKIITACPHCFNTIKNEYPDFGGKFEVQHHSEVINNLISDGRLKLKEDTEKHKVTYHDSCYLGRYNNVYDEPRKSINKIDGIELVEMKRNKDKGFCCGAGGGRMFLEETLGTRINEERTKEALETEADTIASACPFCMTMMEDGLKAFNENDNVVVKDIAEIVLENSI
ncbi:MAG: 4Fe-4S dicluster domain-containing protein [Bacteroidetes bacterium]|nr:4Fe-4S dicluster domain-containing protein [Bacteroidota bacterium]